MFKKIGMVMAVLAVAAVASAAVFYGSARYRSAPGPTVISTTAIGVDHVFITSSGGSAVVGFYNATSATGAVAANLVAAVTVTSATANLDVNVRAGFTRGLVIDSGAATVTAWVVGQNQ